MSCWYTVRQGRIQRGAMGAKPPPWTSEIYWFQGVFRPQRVLSPPGKGKKNLSPPWTNSWIRPCCPSLSGKMLHLYDQHKLCSILEDCFSVKESIPNVGPFFVWQILCDLTESSVGLSLVNDFWTPPPPINHSLGIYLQRNQLVNFFEVWGQRNHS